ncbi:hypothetical protein Dimus_024429 [Dionaea muscipula]
MPSPPPPLSPPPPPQPPQSQFQPQLQMQPFSSQPSTASRRLPPPCWSHDETLALIACYRDKWYALRRGNLRAVHWQEVAEAVGLRCPRSLPPKTSVQCRHKMEKLRKRYRTELQRAKSIPNHRFSSSWIHFKEMDSMEKGNSSSSCPASAPTLAVAAAATDPYEDEDEDEDDNDNYEAEENHPGGFMFDGYDLRGGNGVTDFHGSMSNGVDKSGSGIHNPGGWSSGSGLRAKNFAGFDEKPSSGISCKTNKFSFGGQSFDEGVVRYCTRVVGSGAGVASGTDVGPKLGTGKRAREGEDPVKEMVVAIKKLGEGFVKMERMKMDMAREIEQMRMEMETKRTEMILESQQRMVEAFVKGLLERRNKAKVITTTEP